MKVITRKNLKSFCISIINVLLLTLPLELFAAKPADEPPWYEIEVIVFLNKLELGVKSETWPDNNSDPDALTPIVLHLPVAGEETTPPRDTFDNAAPATLSELQQNADKAPKAVDLFNVEAYELLDKNQFQLNRIYDKLKQSANYQPIIHVAWRQPTLSPEKSLPVYIFDGMDQPQEMAMPTSGQAPNYGIAPGYSANDLSEGPQLQTFSGTIKVSVSRYLHIETDLHLRAPMLQLEMVEVPSSETSDSGDSLSAFFGVKPATTTMMVERNVLKDFRLLETRRMRSTEIHYYDHPKFGVIVVATPYDIKSGT